MGIWMYQTQRLEHDARRIREVLAAVAGLLHTGAVEVQILTVALLTRRIGRSRTHRSVEEPRWKL
jgi:hypothetical protein